jgi:hypothetical protein
MFIRNYGLFWQRDEVNWEPNTGGKFRLMGRWGKYLPGLCVANFRYQHGIYILYGDYGAYYVGLTTELGKRLKDHTKDSHRWYWQRFSWFGFRSVLGSTDENGFCKLKKLAEVTLSKPKKVIQDVEALLIFAMGTDNTNQMNFTQADQWEQIKRDELDSYLEKIS